ncbi:MAG: hypothetical protein AAGH40_14090 [Verrucomicrobiota bacterium]
MTRICLVLLCSWLAVGPLALLQIGAWGWMLGVYTQESSFELAIRETFGGDRPCDVCVLIEEVKEESNENSQADVLTELKLMLGLAKPIIVPKQQPKSYLRTFRDHSLIDFKDHVPTPPPRIV